MAPSTKSHVSNSVDSGIGAASWKTEILFRVWRRGSEHKKLSSPDEANGTQIGIVALIEDVVASRRGVLVPTDENLYISILENPSQALVVARQVQLGMQEFQKKSRIQPIAISIAIDARLQSTQSTETRSNSAPGNDAENPSAPKVEASHDLLTLIRMSKPAQILLTHELFQRVNLFRGLPLKAFQGRFGVFEYLWTEEAKLLEFEGEQSRFVDADEFQSEQTDGIELDGLVSRANSAERAPQYPAVSEKEIASSKNLWRSPWSIATAATLILLLVTAGGIAIRVKKTRSENSSAPIIIKTVTPVPQIPSAPSNLNPLTGPAVSSTIPHEQPAKTNEKTRSALQNNSNLTSRPAHKAEKTTAESTPPKPCSLPGSMDGYLRRAEDYRGRGDYKSAEHLFSEILACESNNEQARLGLAHTKAAEK